MGPNLPKLPRPVDHVQEGPQVVPVVVRVVGAEVDARGVDGGLVAVDGVVAVESEDLFRDLAGAVARAVAPVAEEAEVGGPGAELVDLAQDLSGSPPLANEMKTERRG